MIRMIWVKQKIPFEEGQNAGVIIKQVQFLTVLRWNKLVQCLNIIKMTFSDEKVVLKISWLLVNNGHDIWINEFVFIEF